MPAACSFVMNQARRNGSSLTYNMVRPSLCPSRLLYRGCVNVRVWKGWCLILGPPRSCPSLLGRFPHEQQVGLCERGDDVELLGVRLERQLADGDVLWVRGQQHVQRRRRVQVEVDVLWLIDLCPEGRRGRRLEWERGVGGGGWAAREHGRRAAGAASVAQPRLEIISGVKPSPS